MRERRFYTIIKKLYRGMVITLSKEESYHIVTVLRLKEGAKVIIFNGESEAFEGKIKKIDIAGVIVILENSITEYKELNSYIAVAGALPKNPVLDSYLPKLVDLGVKSIFLFQGDRSVMKIDDSEKKYARLGRKIIEASKLCGRTITPELFLLENIDATISRIKSVIPDYQDAQKWLFDEEIEEENLFSKSLKQNMLKTSQSHILLFGTEGGLTRKEKKIAIESGFTGVSLGRRILRVETAIISAISILLSYIGEM